MGSGQELVQPIQWRVSGKVIKAKCAVAIAVATGGSVTQELRAQVLESEPGSNLDSSLPT